MKKFTKKLMAMLVATIMVMSMTMTAFADAPGTYAVNVYDSKGNLVTNMDAILGADIEYDEDDDGNITSTTVIIYTQMLTVGSYTGYLSSLTIGGVAGTEGNSATSGSISYPTSFTFTFDGNYSVLDVMLSMSYSVTMISGSGTVEHPNTGFLKIVARS